MRFNLQWCIMTSLLLIALPVGAQTAFYDEQLQVPQCLAKQISVPFTTLAENTQFKIISIASTELDTLSLLADKAHCGRYLNVSRYFTPPGTNSHVAKSLLRTKTQMLKKSNLEFVISHQPIVNSALKKIIPANIWQSVSHLAAYYNRSATKNTGLETANWIKAQFDAMVISSGRKNTRSFFVKTGYYQQPSLVTEIGTDLNRPGIVIGAHMDTLDGRMPGAGDDASGSSSILEAARILLSTTETLQNPIYIIWYAAEERGLVGSQYVVDYFKEHNIPIQAVIQFDMTGYRVNPADSTIWLYTDYTNKPLTSTVAELISAYVKVPVAYSSCGYGCSDHASWNNEGVPAAFPCESNFDDHNPYIHTANDTMEHLNLEHMTNFTKLAIAFALELALK